MSFPRLASAALVFTFGLVALAPAARAQGEPPPPRTIGADALVVLPLGDYGDAASFAVGAAGKIEFPLNAKLSITGRAGVLYHFLKGDADGSLWFIPIYGGAKFALGAGHDGPYVAGELGITFAYAQADTQFGSASDSDSKLGGSLGAGLRRGSLDIRGALFIPDLGHVDDPGIMGSVGFDFAT